MFKRVFLFLVLSCGSTIARAETSPKTTPSPARTTKASSGPIVSSGDFDRSQPTFIKSDALVLKSEERKFTYTGNVEIKNGDLTLVSDRLDGLYNEKSQIEKLTARGNVVVTKGERIKATSEVALYDAASQVITLTENPQVEQGGSLLTADTVKIYLAENRSEALGEVRVKLIQKDSGGQLPIGK